jgi:Protein of unknown function (DUF3238)
LPAATRAPSPSAAARDPRDVTVHMLLAMTPRPSALAPRRPPAPPPCRSVPTVFDDSHDYDDSQVETHYKTRRFAPDSLGNGLVPGVACECELDLPNWACATLKAGEQPAVSRRSDGELSATPGSFTPSKGTVQLKIAAANPLYGTAIVPDINLDVTVTLERVAACEARVTCKGKHDGFPWYEFYANAVEGSGVRSVHTYSGADAGPTALVGGGDQAVDASVSVTTC